jgi:tetratricopeptide (TPR) repeat protein
MQGDLHRAIADARQALAAKERALGPDAPDVGISLMNLSGYLVEAGFGDEGIAASLRAIQVLTAGFGPEHPKNALALSNHGEWLLRMRRFRDALGFAERALAIFQREMDPQGLFVAHAQWVIGVGAYHEGDFERARDALECAQRNRARANAIAAERGEVNFALGRTLVDGNLDKERGLALVQRAREEYQQAPRNPFVAADLAEVESWLAARP